MHSSSPCSLFPGTRPRLVFFIGNPSNVFDINIAILRAAAILVKLKANTVLVLVAVSVGLVDLRVLGQFAVGFQTAGFVGGVLHQDVTFAVLVFSEGPELNRQYPALPLDVCVLKTYRRIMSPWFIQTFFRSLPRICASRTGPSKHFASKRPLPSILTTWAYSVVGLRLDGVFASKTDRTIRTLSILLEDEFTLLVVILILTPTSILATLHNLESVCC